jgi:hypothetical protein
MISVRGELPWAAAVGFVFVAGVALLIWRRTRTREELAPQKLATEGAGAHRIEDRAAPLIAVENAVGIVVEDSEENGDGERVPDQPAPQETISSPVTSEVFESPSGDARAPEKPPVEDVREADVDVAVLPPVVEAVPAMPDMESEEERDQETSGSMTVDCAEEITAEISEIAQEKPSELPGDGGSATFAEPIVYLVLVSSLVSCFLEEPRQITAAHGWASALAPLLSPSYFELRE